MAKESDVRQDGKTPAPNSGSRKVQGGKTTPPPAPNSRRTPPEPKD